MGSGKRRGAVGDAKVIHNISNLNHVILPGRLHADVGLSGSTGLRVFIRNSRVVLGGCHPANDYSFYNRISSGTVRCTNCYVYASYHGGVNDVGGWDKRKKRPVDRVVSFALPSYRPKQALRTFHYIPRKRIQTILRLSRKVIRFVSHCGPLTRGLTTQNVLIANGSRLNRNKSVHAGRSCNCFNRPSNGHTLLRSLRTIAALAGRLCPNIPCFLLNRDVNSFCTQRCLYR